jgi:hypothetical protein
VGINSTQHDNLLLEVADKCREALVDEVRARAKKAVSDAGLLYSEDQTLEIEKQFLKGLPCNSVTSLASICNAGWNLFISNILDSKNDLNLGFNKKEYPKLLNELMLKSFEIFEIETELKEQDTCSTQMQLKI